MKLKLFSFLFFFALFSHNQSLAMRIDIEGEDNRTRPRNTLLNQNSLEDDLRWSYSRMIIYANTTDFERRAERFQDEIFHSFPLNQVPNQQDYIEEIQDLYGKIDSYFPYVLDSFFKKYRDKMRHRITLAKIDNQLNTNQGIRGRFDYQHIDVAYVGPLNALVGQIFHVTQEGNQPKEAHGIGSAFASFFENNSPKDMIGGRQYQLNGVITAAHVLSCSDNERNLGVYFVPNAFLDPDTGIPLQTSQGIPINSRADLLFFLENDSQCSYQINTYTGKSSLKDEIPLIESFQGNKKQSYLGNSLSQNNPQYKDNEDIVFGYFKNQTIPYNQGNINVSYESIRNIVYNFQNGERYFVMGYPGCKHYSKRVNDYNLNQALQNKIGRNVVQDLGLSPLIVTSQTATAFPQLPRYNNGFIEHGAPNAKGMSGGPMLTIANNRINFLGCISSGDINGEYVCF